MTKLISSDFSVYSQVFFTYNLARSRRFLQIIRFIKSAIL